MAALRPKKQNLPRSSRRDPQAASSLLTCESDSVRQRLERIETNYLKLDQLLADLESRVPQAKPESAEEGVESVGNQSSVGPKKPR